VEASEVAGNIDLDARIAALEERLKTSLAKMAEELNSARIVWYSGLSSFAVALLANKVLTERDLDKMLGIAENVAGQLEEAAKAGIPPEQWFTDWLAPMRRAGKASPRRKGARRNARRKRT